MKAIRTKIFLLTLMCFGILGCTQQQKTEEKTDQRKETLDPKKLVVSENGRFITTGDGKPFFWLGDTGWLLFNRLSRDEVVTYLDNRKKLGFNVVQVMVLHDIPSRNVYLDSSLVKANVAHPAVTEGNDPADSLAYDFWDHIDYTIQQAADRGIYMALVPVWGTNVKNKKVNKEQAVAYAEFLAKRYKDQWNIIWLNGGDIKGSEGMDVWKAIGETLRKNDPNHLITFHPRGRTASSDWFHKADWLDFNMVQSGHRRYEQDTSKKETNHYGQDNYKYINVDYKLNPIKPTIDGEPSYEDIPHGLHDIKEKRWTASDVRRYGYWSVFAGAFGYTYGHNSVMQMYKKSDLKPAYGPHDEWFKAINAEGATQMIHLKNLMLSRSYFDRVPAQDLVVDNGTKYNYVAATKGDTYAMFYTYTGAPFKVNLAKLNWPKVKYAWFNPHDGKFTEITKTDDKAPVATFQPAGGVKDGNDWVLVIDKQ